MTATYVVMLLLCVILLGGIAFQLIILLEDRSLRANGYRPERVFDEEWLVYREELVNFDSLHRVPSAIAPLFLLSQYEIEAISDLLSADNSKTKPLKDIYVRYMEQLNALHEVQDALINERAIRFDDQIITCCSIKTPIIFYKSYLNEKGESRIVPGLTYITDEDNIRVWFATKSSHPITRDSIAKPCQYNKCVATYAWHRLTSDSCYSPELHEMAAKLKEALIPPPKPDQVPYQQGIFTRPAEDYLVPESMKFKLP